MFFCDCLAYLASIVNSTYKSFLFIRQRCDSKQTLWSCVFLNVCRALCKCQVKIVSVPFGQNVPGGLNAHWNQWSNHAGLIPSFSDHSHHGETSQFSTQIRNSSFDLSYALTDFGILRMAFVLPKLPVWSLGLDLFSGPAEGQWDSVGFQVSLQNQGLGNWHKWNYFLRGNRGGC